MRADVTVLIFTHLVCTCHAQNYLNVEYNYKTSYPKNFESSSGPKISHTYMTIHGHKMTTTWKIQWYKSAKKVSGNYFSETVIIFQLFVVLHIRDKSCRVFSWETCKVLCC